MLVYLKYCFTGLAFPPGNFCFSAETTNFFLLNFLCFCVSYRSSTACTKIPSICCIYFAGRGTIPATRLPSLKKELVQFLLEDSNALKSRTVSDLGSRGPWLNLYLLLELDTEATLDVLRCAFVENEISIASSLSMDLAEQDDEGEKKDTDNVTETQHLLVQNTVDALIRIIDKIVSPMDTTSSSGDDGSVKEWPSKKDIGHLFEFIAHYVALQKAKVSKRVLFEILEYLTSESLFSTTGSLYSSTPKKREKQVLALLIVLPESDWDSSVVLDLCERAQFHQVQCPFW